MLGRLIRRRRGAQRGFTLIELMVAMLVSTLLVGMILAIFARISLAYRSQQQVTGLQQVLASARGMMEVDAKQCGLGISQGYKVAVDGFVGTHLMHSPLEVTNSSTGPDQVTFSYGDPNVQAAITASGWPTSVTVDSATGFQVNDVVVLSTPTLTTQSPVAPGTDANIATFDACVLQISAIAGNVLTFSQSAPWGRLNNDHCHNPGLYAPMLNTSGTGTMVFKFVSHAYRISTTVPGDGQLEMSPSGNLNGVNDWVPLAFGFTDLQIATKFYDADITDQDGDGDATRDFYSGASQQTLTAPISKLGGGQFVPPIQMSISLVARTDRDVEGIATAATPSLVGAIPTNNSLGDRGSFALPGAVGTFCDANCVLANAGTRIYRFSTFTVDLRNMGVGR